MSAAGLPPAQEVVERALSAASGSDGAIVIVEESSEAEFRFARNTTTTNGVRRGRTVTVITTNAGDEGVSVGVATRSGPVDIEDLVRASAGDAATSPPAEDASPLLTDIGTDADYGEPPVPTSLAGLGSLVGDLGGAFERARASRTILAGFAEHHSDTAYLGTSTGGRRRHVQPTGKLEIVARSEDGTRSSWAGLGAADLASVELESYEQQLARRLAWAERQIELPAGPYEVLLPGGAVADLMTYLWIATSGREAEDGSSVFSAPGGGTRVGEVLAETPFDLRSDPAEPGIECAPFVIATASGPDNSVFDNGMPIGRTSWIKDGRLERLCYHRARAAESGTQATPLGDNLVLELPGATASLEEMVARTERALLVTCLWYVRLVDPVTLLLTGITRDGVYLVENGEVVGAVNNFRFNESPIDVLAKTIEAGRIERSLSREWNEWLSRTITPPLRVADFNMSSVSPAT